MTYMGAKTGAGVYQAIIALMPPHDTYIEPFVGSGAILTLKAPAFQSIILDLDPAMVGRLADRSRTTAIAGCGLQYLASLDVRRMGRVLVYEDPPYVLATRGEKRYRHDFQEVDHRELAGINKHLSAMGVRVILSGYPSELYDRLYGGWNTREFQAMTRGGVRTEKLWFNFEPDAVHWATHAGADFTDRQRIKRKAARWAQNFAKLPPAERQAVLAAILGPQPWFP